MDRYNHIVKLNNWPYNQNNSLKALPSFAGLLENMTQRQKALLLLILTLATFIPFANIVASCLLLVLTLLKYWIDKTVQTNYKSIPDPFSKMLPIEELCVDQAGVHVPSQYYYLKVSPGSLPDSLRELFYSQLSCEEFYFIAYRPYIVTWYKGFHEKGYIETSVVFGVWVFTLLIVISINISINL